ncbi:GAP family protein [Kitasatospora atroaurantiaca]|uniref:Sap-like sulfolipid-1-addressing protein n=1 Tax=Kitasatospora atroaurantiaca TaxID=285545 RepID=A0A561ER11_9ACTN|nr:GAP family protein [Kitasatospora atroaurantiaca]TWE18053.1 Sap-like sulfolipid-1-addressing protein [Kitasatospora atroaurantiaca]
MGDAIGQMLASAVGIAISPVPLIAVVLMLATPRGRVNGTAFTLGWVAALAAVATLVVLAGSGLDTAGPRPTWSWWVKLAAGVLLLLLALRQWHDRPRAGHVRSPPKWMQTIDRFTPERSAGLAAQLVAANPKNLVLTVGGAVSIATSTASGAGKTVAVVLMVLVGSLCTLGPLCVHLVGGARSAKVLGEWKAWMSAHNSAVLMVVLVVMGATYVGDAVSGLTV